MRKPFNASVPASPSDFIIMKTQMNQISNKITPIACALFAGMAILAAPGAFAQNATDAWGGNSTVNLSDAGNWTTGNTPPINGDNWLFGPAGTAGAVLNNSYATGITVSNLTFLSTAGAYTFTNNNPIVLIGSITNASTALQTFNVPMSNAVPATLSLTAGGGNITIGGMLTSSSNLTLAGAGTLTLTDSNYFTGAITIGANDILAVSGPTAAIGTNPPTTANYSYPGAVANSGQLIFGSSLTQTNTGVISGAGTVTVSGPGLVVMNGGSSFTGNLVVNGGTLNDAIAEASGNPTVGGLGNMRTASKTVTVNNGASLILSGPGGNEFGYGGVSPLTPIIVNQGGLLQITSGGATMPPIILNGATFSVAASTGAQYGNGVQSIGVGGTSPSAISYANGVVGPPSGINLTIGGGVGAQMPFAVTNTGAGGPDLVVSVSMVNANASQNSTGFVLTGGGTMELTGTNIFTGPITISNGTVIVGGAGQLGSGFYGGNIYNYGNFIYSSSAPQFFSGSILNSGGITVSSPATVYFEAGPFIGAGPLTNNGPGTTYIFNASYSGLTAINGGEVVFFSSQTSTAPVSVNDAGTLAVIPTPGVAAGFSPATLNVGSLNGGNILVTINSTTQAPLTVGALNLVGNNNTITVSAGATLLTGQDYPVLSYTSLGGSLAPANFVPPAGVSGTFSANTSAGVTTWSLHVSSAPTPSTLTWTGVTHGISGVWDIGTTANWKSGVSAVDYQDGDLVLFDDSASFFTVGGVSTVSPAGVTFNNSVNNYALLNGVVIAGAGGMTLNGSGGSVTNAEVDLYTGPTVINNGTLVAGTNSAGLGGPLGALYAPVSLANSATAALKLNGFSVQAGSLAGGGSSGGNVALGSGNLTVGADGTSKTYGGVISGIGSLTMAGTGSLTLTNTNTFTGTLTIGAGNTLTISNTALGSAGIPGSYNFPNAIVDNGTMVYSTSLIQTNSGVMSGNGGLILNGPGTLALNNQGNTFTNNVVVNGGTLALTIGAYGNRASSALGNQQVQGRTATVNNSGVLLFYSNNVFAGGTFAQTISLIVNQGGLVEVMYPTENEAFSNIFLNGGTLFAGPGTGQAAYGSFMIESNVYVGGAVPSSITAAVAASGNGLGYDLGSGKAAGYQTGFVVSNTAGGSLAGGADLIVSGSLLNTSASTANATGFIKSGPGTMLLSGTNFFTGPITVSSGVVNLGGAGSLTNGFGGNIAISNNATFLFTSSQPQILTSVISGAGALVVSNTTGPGLTLTNDISTYTGPTVIGAGTLLLGGSASIASSSPIAISNGAVLDVTGLTSGSTAGSGQTVMGFGHVNGNFTSTANSTIEGGVPGTLGTLNFNNNLTLGPASSIKLAVGTLASGPNGSVAVTGTLACSGAQLHLTAPSGQDLDKQNYTLVTAGSLAGSSFSPAVAWDVAPANANHYYISVVGNSVVLTYSSIPIPTPGGVTSPATVLRNQSALLVVTVVPGDGTVTNVTVDASGVGGLASLALAQNGVANTWTNTVAIGPALLAGAYLLPATAIDTIPVTGYGIVTLFVVPSTETWAGAGGDENFDTALNWAVESGQPVAYAPGYVGDMLVFAGAANLAPVMDNSYSVNGLTFANGAGAFNITAAGTNVLTLTGAGVTNLSTSSETLALPVVSAFAGPEIINTAKGNLAMSQGLGDANGGLLVIGSSNFTLAGASTFTGPLDVRQGAMTLAGATEVNTNIVYVGDSVGSNAVLSVASGGSLVISNTAGGGAFLAELTTGNTTNAAAVVNLSAGGSISAPTGALNLGNGRGSYDYFNMTGGNATFGSFVYVANNSDRARFDMSGGNFTITSNLMSIGSTYGQSNAVGVVNLSGGTYNSLNNESYAGRGGGLFVGEFGIGVLNISGTAVVNAWGDTNVVMGVWSSGNSGGQPPSGTINLLGGALVTAQVVGGNGSSTFNFNGGLLSNYNGSIIWFANAPGPFFMYNVSNTYVYPGGAFIDDGGTAITINEPLQTPGGYGVASIAVTNGGSGYIAPPVVIITGGTGTGATANAVVSGGAVTALNVTCPGTGYSGSDTLTVTLVGGGVTSTLGKVAGAKAPVLAPNGSGGLTYTSQAGAGSGTLTLAAPCTYTNATIIKNGTLQVGPGGSLSSSAVLCVSNGATLDCSGAGGLNLGGNQTLIGGGTVVGLVKAASGSKIYPGADPAVGTLLLNSGLNMQAGATATFDLSTSGATGNDQVAVYSQLSFVNNAIHIKAPSTLSLLDTSTPYVLFQNGASSLGGLPAVAPVFDVAPANANVGFWLIQPSGNSIVLLNSVNSPPGGSGSITVGATSGTNIVRNTTITVSATVSGPHPISSVYVDLSAYGGGTINYLTHGAGNTWSGTVAIPAGLPPGAFGLPILAYDGTLYGEISLLVNVLTTTDTWNGADFVSNPDSDDNGNWVGGAAPGYVGDSVIFAGGTGLTPVFDQNYSFNGIGFASGAGLFVLGGGTVGVVGGVTNNSANVESLNVPIDLTGTSPTFNGASGNLVLSNTLSGSGQLNAAGAGGVTLDGMVSYSGNTFIAAGGSLIMGATGQWLDALGNTTYSGGTSNNGTFIYDSPLIQTNAGVISGTGNIIVNAGALILSGANSYTGNLIINGGTVYDPVVEGVGAPVVGGLGNPQSTNTTTINSGGTLILNAPGGNEFGYGAATPPSLFVVNTNGLLQVTSGNAVMGPITLNGGTLSINSANGPAVRTL